MDFRLFLFVAVLISSVLFQKSLEENGSKFYSTLEPVAFALAKTTPL